jgi:hypothetical protein
MARLVYLTLGVVVAIAISVASAQTTGRASPRVRSLTGVVTAVSASYLIVRVGRKETKLNVDSSTRLLTYRRKTRPRDLVYRERRLTDLIKAGDHVTVKYTRAGSVKKAVEVRVAQP